MPLFASVLFSLEDACYHVRELAYNVVKTGICPRMVSRHCMRRAATRMGRRWTKSSGQKDLLLVYFLETLSLMTGYYDHPETKPMEFIHLLQRQVCANAKTLSLYAFASPADAQMRFLVYSRLLALSQEQSKHLLTSKIVHDFLKPLADLETKEVDAIPIEENTPAALAISDALRVLSSADLKLRFARDEDAEADVDHSKGKSRYEHQLMITYLSQTILPVLVSFLGCLRNKNSVLQRNVVEAIRDISYEYRGELESLIGDKGIRKTLERYYSEVREETLWSLLDDVGIRSRLVDNKMNT